jgi:predicted component of type VI protein secretion system
MNRYRIGRADTNDIVLADATVSREHAELVELGGGRFEIKDLGSTYGVSILEGEGWRKVTETELRHDSQLRIGDYQTTVAELLRDTDRTVVRPRAPEPPSEGTAPPAAAAPPPEAPPASVPPAEPPAASDDDATAPPPARTAPAAPKRAPAPLRPAPPRPATSRPAPPHASPPRTGATTPPQPAAPPFQFLRNLPPEKRILVWLGLGFAGFLLVALITLILALAL